MGDETSAQTLGKREIIESLDREFARLHVNSCAAIENIPTGVLYAVPEPSATTSSLPSETNSMFSIGESILRSAAVVEQAFGGITSNLWDDPFEWTLREYLSTPAKVKAHLAEVETTRTRAFSSFADDDCLLKHIAMPSGKTQPLIALLLETLVAAVDYQAQALVALKMLSGISPPRFII
jgi:hypothetical protein